MRFRRAILFILPLIFSSCVKRSVLLQTRYENALRNSAREIQKEVSSIQKAQNSALDSFISNMRIEEKISQLFMTNLVGNDIFIPIEHAGDLYGRRGEGSALIAGGYLFFSYNIADTPEQLMRFTDSILQYCVENNIVPPLIAADQEGGAVSRLRSVNAPLPPARKVSLQLDVSEAYKLYSMQARQMKLLGFNMNVSPVAEILTDENRSFLDDRSFGSAKEVMMFGAAAVNAFENNNIAAVLKHFPGNTDTDPHSGLPEIRMELSELEKMILPFKKLCVLKPSAVLMSHARTLAVDDGKSACFSEYWISQRLRRDFCFVGVIFSDDIFMAALSENGYPPEKAAVTAVDAGVDCIMISEKRFALPASSLIKKMQDDNSFAQKVNDSVKRILQLKIKLGLLEFQTDGNNTVLVIARKKPESIEERIARFNSVRNENIDFVRKHFN